MSGSLAHIIGGDGALTFDRLDGLKDCGMTIRELYNVIVVLSGEDMKNVSAACRYLGYVDPYDTERYDDDPMPKPMKISDL